MTRVRVLPEEVFEILARQAREAIPVRDPFNGPECCDIYVREKRHHTHPLNPRGQK